jgi:hypothetical protein
MSDEERRNQQIEKIGQDWLEKDPAAAQAWLQSVHPNGAQKP